MNNESIKTISEGVDAILYFVSCEDVQLKSSKEKEVAAKVAKVMDLKLYGMRSGPDVQNPKTLFEELNNLDIEKFEIIFFSVEFDEVSVLSHSQKELFVFLLEGATINSGLVAKEAIERTEGIQY